MNDFREIIVSEDITLNEAISSLSFSPERALLVINNNKKLVGILSEGDIMRALIKGADSFSSINHWITRDYKFLTEYNLRQALLAFNEFGISIIPIVDKYSQVTDVIGVFDLLKHIDINGFE